MIEKKIDIFVLKVLPINIGVSSVFNNVHKVANRLGKELGK